MSKESTIRRIIASGVAALLCSMTLAACRSDVRPAAGRGVTVTTGASSAPAAEMPESAYAPAALVARFREQSPEHPSRFGAGATRDLDSLIARYVRGVEQADTASLAALALTRDEFAWLYYLDSPMAQKPYELDPDAMWQQLAARGARGRDRALAMFGHHSLGAWRRECAPPRTSGNLRLYDCAVLSGPTHGAQPRRLRLSVVERDGLFKLTGLATSL